MDNVTKFYTNLMCGDLTRFFVEIIINCIRSWDFLALLVDNRRRRNCGAFFIINRKRKGERNF